MHGIDKIQSALMLDSDRLAAKADQDDIKSKTNAWHLTTQKSLKES